MDEHMNIRIIRMNRWWGQDGWIDEYKDLCRVRYGLDCQGGIFMFKPQIGVNRDILETYIYTKREL